MSANPTTFVATVSAGSAAEAVAKLTPFVGAEASGHKRLDGFSVTGRVSVWSERHRLFDVEMVAAAGADVNNGWVVLTSYGIVPSTSLGSAWQEVAGVGA